MKIILNLEDLISKENITENMPTIVEIPFNKVITLEDLPRSKSALHYHLYYTDVIQKLLKEGLIKKEQVEWGLNRWGFVDLRSLRTWPIKRPTRWSAQRHPLAG